MQVLGIDIGGSGIKGALVDLESGELVTDRLRIETPSSFGLEAVTETITTLVNEFDYEGPVGIGFPAAVANGIVLTAPTAHHVPGWVDQSVDKRFSEATGCNVQVLNDADAAGLADTVRREVIVQHEIVAPFALQSIDNLGFALGTEGGSHQRLGFAAREQRRAVRAR